MRRLAISALVALLATNVSAQAVGIKDFALGADLRVEAARAGLQCQASSSGADWCSNPSGTYMELGATIAGVPTKLLLLAGYENKLGWVMFRFDQARFPVVRAAFAEKYPGMRCHDSIVQNRMGAAFEQTECVISSPTAKLTLSRRTTDLAQGGVELRSIDYDRQMKADFDKQKGQAKKDI